MIGQPGCTSWTSELLAQYTFTHWGSALSFRALPHYFQASPMHSSLLADTLEQREGNHVTDGRRIRQQHAEPVQAHAHPPRRRQAILQRPNEVLIQHHLQGRFVAGEPLAMLPSGNTSAGVTYALNNVQPLEPLPNTILNGQLLTGMQQHLGRIQHSREAACCSLKVAPHSTHSFFNLYVLYLL